jgi:hypothetical protein
MNEKIERMIEEVKRRGGVVGFASDAPEELIERFLMEVLDCADCQIEISREPMSH